MSKSVAVTTDDPAIGVIRVSMSFTVVTPINIKPAARLYLTGVRGQRVSERVLLHRTDGKPLQVELPGSANEGVAEVRAVPVTTREVVETALVAEPGDVWIEASVAADAEPSYESKRLSLGTNLPELPVLDLPLTVRVRDLIEARPATVQLWMSPGAGNEHSVIFRVNHNLGKEFMVTGVDVSHPQVFSASFVGKGAARAQNIRVTLAEDVAADELARPVRGTIRLAFDDTQQDSLEVPVIVGRRSGSTAVQGPSRDHRGSPATLNLPPPATPPPKADR